MMSMPVSLTGDDTAWAYDGFDMGVVEILYDISYQNDDILATELSRKRSHNMCILSAWSTLRQ